MYLLQFDGMLHTLDESPPQAGMLGYGWLLTYNNIEIAHGFGLFFSRGTANSNLAEYLALIEGLEALVDLRIGQAAVEVRGDARCIIDQMNGDASVSAFATRKLHKRAYNLARHFPQLTWKWVPRKENKPADRLSRRSLRQLHDNPRAYEAILSQVNSLPRHQKGLVSLMDLRLYHSHQARV